METVKRKVELPTWIIRFVKLSNEDRRVCDAVMPLV
jgi:hypothetical protein